MWEANAWSLYRLEEEEELLSSAKNSDLEVDGDGLRSGLSNRHCIVLWKGNAFSSGGNFTELYLRLSFLASRRKLSFIADFLGGNEAIRFSFPLDTNLSHLSSSKKHPTLYLNVQRGCGH